MNLKMLLLIFIPSSIFAQSEAETKAFIENIVLHNPSHHLNFYYRFFFKSDKFGFSGNIAKCPPKKVDYNAPDFMIIEQKNVKEGKYSSDYLRISYLIGYKVTTYDNAYYIELQTKGSEGAFFEMACVESNWSSTTLSTTSKEDALKLIKALKHLCNLYKTSFVDLDNLFNDK